MPGRDRHLVGREGERPAGRPARHLAPGPVGAPLQHVERDGEGGRGREQVADREPLVVGAAGADEEHARAGALGQQPRRGRRGGEGADPGEGHPPARRRRGVEAGQLGREGGEEEGVHGRGIRGPAPGSGQGDRRAAAGRAGRLTDGGSANASVVMPAPIVRGSAPS